MTDKTELLPCPFCGSDVHLSEFEGITSIVCASGDACASSKLIVAYPSDDYENALLAWNTRAAPAEDVRADGELNTELYADYVAMRADRDSLREALIELVKVNDEHNQSMISIIGRPAMWNDSYLDKARKAIAAPAEVRYEDARAVVEEPVAYLTNGGKAFYFPSPNIEKADGDTPLYRHPQRPVVLPEREMYSRYFRGIIPENRLEVEAYKDGWNACLDAVERLNK